MFNGTSIDEIKNRDILIRLHAGNLDLGEKVIYQANQANLNQQNNELVIVPCKHIQRIPNHNDNRIHGQNYKNPLTLITDMLERGGLKDTVYAYKQDIRLLHSNLAKKLTSLVIEAMCRMDDSTTMINKHISIRLPQIVVQLFHKNKDDKG